MGSGQEMRVGCPVDRSGVAVAGDRGQARGDRGRAESTICYFGLRKRMRLSIRFILRSA
jgi:hypothetical protein